LANNNTEDPNCYVAPRYVALSYVARDGFHDECREARDSKGLFKGTIGSKNGSKQSGVLHFAQQYQWDVGETYRLINSVGPQSRCGYAGRGREMTAE
jgi:hypothetical protein